MTLKHFFAIPLLVLFVGCKMNPVKITIISDKENTNYRIQEYGSKEWTNLGTGKIIKADLTYLQRPWVIVAKPPGYREKTHILTEPVRNLRFTFLLEDQEQYVDSWGNTQRPSSLQPQTSASISPAFEPETSSRISAGIDKRWAILIGISKYKDSGQKGLTDLAYASDDAQDFANTLINTGWNDGHIKLLTDQQATKRNIEIALESWLTKAGSDDMITLFWSGHGFPDPEDPEKVYFACYDTDIRIPATGYRMDKVRSAIEECGVRNVVMLADTCHAGKLITRGDEKAIGIAPYVDSMVKKQNVPKGWIFMVASDVDRKAIEDSSWSHGAFTHCLLKALDGEADGYQSAGTKDGIVTMGELRAYMNTAMPDETQKVIGVAKHPMITTSTGDPGIWDLSLSTK